MSDDSLDTLTTIEAKVLCMRYGIKNIDELEDLHELEVIKDSHLDSEQSISKIAEQLGQDDNIIEESEQSGLRKLAQFG